MTLQAVLQPPQWVGSLVVSTQLAPHVVKAPLQVVAHTPTSQTSAPMQATAQSPQWVASLVMSAQTPLHSVWLSAQPASL